VVTPVWADAPRLAPARSFPPRAFVPGRTPRPPESEHEPRHVPPERWRDDEAYLFGIDLYHAGYLWEAHEQWEGIWKASADETQRHFLQGLIQLAAALLKLRTDNARGARKLAARAQGHLARVPGERYMGLALAPLRAFAGRPRADDAPRLEPR